MPADRHLDDFLADDCGQNALQLAARGSALIAEILRLCEHIPAVFVDPSKSPQYAKIICDFEYFPKQDDFEKRIQSSVELLERDEEFRETHIELLERFFKLFRGVFGYATELNRFVSDIREGMYLSQSLESVLVHPDGKQLICEIYYLYGVMLLLLDVKMGGKIREYLIVSYIRYKGAGDQHTVEVAGMSRSTGYTASNIPDRYPEKYFSRVAIDKTVVEMVIGRIRSDDVYQSAYHYPAPEHRSTALSAQSSMLYVLLFFVPHVLERERQVMREIVDKHFVDNWILPFYLGFTVDLAVSWAPFGAAFHALQGTMAIDNVQYHLQRHKRNLAKLSPQVDALLREGVLTEQYVLDNIHSTLLPCIREANVTLRWFILHMTRSKFARNAKFKKSYETVAAAVQADDVLTLLLGVAQLEFSLKSMFQQLLKAKRSKWREAKEQAATKMSKLAQYFSGEHVLSDNVRVAPLESWFSDMSTRIDSLSYADSTTANRKIQKLMKALENVQEFHHIDENLQVVQFLHDTRHLMRQMIRIINIERKVLITIGTVGDLSYAWELFATHRFFVDDIQRQIKKEPRLVLQMRSVFVKMSTMLDLPCTRIAQATTNDPTLEDTLESVSEYYSAELVKFVGDVLHVIPLSIFGVLKEIMKILVTDMKQCPTKLNKADMKEQSQPLVRQRLGRLTSEVSQFASGILAMESTLVGVIQVDPHQLLENGIRVELVTQITNELNALVTYDAKKLMSAEQLDAMLAKVATQLGGMKSAFEYVQDYVNVHGLQIWLQEFTRIVNFNVDLESNAFMLKKLYHWQSQFQSDRIRIPYMGDPAPGDAYSFLGRLTLHLMRMTMRAVYIPALGAWYELPGGSQTVGARTFTSVLGAVGPQGLAALDRLLCFSAAKECQILIAEIRRIAESVAESLEQVQQGLLPTSSSPTSVLGKHYESMAKGMGPLFEILKRSLHRVGRMQLLRRKVAKELRSNCKLNSGALFNAVNSANECLLADLDRHYAEPHEHPMPGSIVPAICPFLDAAGITNSTSKVYITSKPMPALAFIMAALQMHCSNCFAYNPRHSCLIPLHIGKKDAFLDASSLAYGTVTLIRQFHADQMGTFLGLMAQASRVLLLVNDPSQLEPKKAAAAPVVPERAVVLGRMLENIADASGVPVSSLARAVPSHMLTEVP